MHMHAIHKTLNKVKSPLKKKQTCIQINFLLKVDKSTAVLKISDDL